jgi:uncharacterized Zn finger protein
MPLPSISESLVRQKSNANSFSRGQAYMRQGAVMSLIQRGPDLYAEVGGSEDNSYHIHIGFDAGGLKSARCSCPYNFGGWCKHIVATLLTCIHQPEDVDTRPALAELLNSLNQTQLKDLIQALVKDQPELLETIDLQVNMLTALKPKSSKAKASRRLVDIKPFQQQMRSIIREGVRQVEDGYDDDPFTDDLIALVDRARTFSEHGDGENAIAILTAITEAFIKDKDDMDDYGYENFEFLEYLNVAWTEAILTANIPKSEVAPLRHSLEGWQDEIDLDLSMSLAALEQGWQDPTLQAILAGTLTREKFWQQEQPDFVADLALIRLEILDRQDREAEYLNLAWVAKLTEKYLIRLVQVGDIDRVVTLAKTELSTVDESFALAKALREAQHLPEALTVAQLGLAFTGSQFYDLAVWAGALAEGMKQPKVALQAYQAAFAEKASFNLYQQLQTLAGKSWQKLQPTLLAELEKANYWGSDQAKVDIFLYENMLDKAIATVKKPHFYDSALLLRVMDAVTAYKPDWVIQTALPRAEEIINAGKSKHYPAAVDWLKRAKAAYLQSKRQDDWRTYRQTLEFTHGRKRSLMEQMGRAGV